MNWSAAHWRQAGALWAQVLEGFGRRDRPPDLDEELIERLREWHGLTREQACERAVRLRRGDGSGSVTR
jgi:hypothetical protein